MNFFSQAVPMDIDVNIPITPMHVVPMHAVPKHVTFVSNYAVPNYAVSNYAVSKYAVSNYAKPTQVVHYVYSDPMIIDEHPNKVIIR